MAPLERRFDDSPRAVFDIDGDDGFTFLHPSHPLQQEDDNTKVSVKTPKKQLRFSDSVIVWWIEDKKAYPDERKGLIWYKKKDFNRFKESCRRIVEWVDSRHQFAFGPDVEEDNSYFCSRGLERYTRDGNVRFLERTNARANDMYVLRLTGANPEEIAALMAVHSTPCVSEALDRARHDAQSARIYERESSSGRRVLSSKALPNMLPEVRAIWDQRDEILSTKGLKSMDRQPIRPVRYT